MYIFSKNLCLILCSQQVLNFLEMGISPWSCGSHVRGVPFAIPSESNYKFSDAGLLDIRRPPV